MNKRAYIRLSSIIWAIMLSFAFKVHAKNNPADTTLIMLIDDVPVYQVELNREMNAFRSDVFSEYTAAHRIQSKENFWNTAFEGKTPFEDLQQRAIKSLVKLKVQEKLLIAKGLWPYKNYEELLSDMHTQNSKRQKAYFRKEVIYGPTYFTPQTFFEYQFSNALIKLKNTMRGQEIPVNEALLKTHFEDLRNSIYNSPSISFDNVKQQVEEHYIEAKYKALIEAISSEARIKPIH